MRKGLRYRFTLFSKRFNRLPKASRVKLAVSLTAFLLGCLIWLIIVLETQVSETQIGTISIPIIRHINTDTMRQERLIPLGKMKGEVNGQFDSFYVAIDKDARIFINRDLSYGADAYLQSKRWEEITRARLAEYERNMSFRPINQKSKSLKP